MKPFVIYAIKQNGRRFYQSCELNEWPRIRRLNANLIVHAYIKGDLLWHAPV